MSDIDPQKLKVVELREELKLRGLDTKGNKAQLVKRLEEALENEVEQAEEAQESDDATDENAASPPQDPTFDVSDGEDSVEGKEDFQVVLAEGADENKADMVPEPQMVQQWQAEPEPAAQPEPEPEPEPEPQPMQEPEPEPEPAQAEPVQQPEPVSVQQVWQAAEMQQQSLYEAQMTHMQKEEPAAIPSAASLVQPAPPVEDPDKPEPEPEPEPAPAMTEPQAWGDGPPGVEEPTPVAAEPQVVPPPKVMYPSAVQPSLDDGESDEPPPPGTGDEPPPPGTEPVVPVATNNSTTTEVAQTIQPVQEEPRGIKRGWSERYIYRDTKRYAVVEESEEWLQSRNFVLDRYNCDLNLRVSDSGLKGNPVTVEGFGFMWAGVRANFGVTKGKVTFEVKIKEHLNVDHLPPEETSRHVVRVGMSTDSTSMQLGEEPFSYGYGGTGKSSLDCKFTDYGETFGEGDIIGCYVDMDSDPITISYTKNATDFGTCFTIEKSTLEGKALFPHVLTKNCEFDINFGSKDEPYMPLKEGYTFMESTPEEDRIRGSAPPAKKEDCEIIMMCGLPGSGKTTWAQKHATENPEKKFFVLGTNNIIDKMKVMGLPRKRNYAGRWDVLIDKATKCLNRMLEIAAKKKRNYILDQTNVYPSAQRRKMRPFEGFQRKAIVIVPTDEEFKRRCEQREKEEGKEVPDQAVLEMKANFELPEVGQNFDAIEYVELEHEEAKKLVEQYSSEASAVLPPPEKRWRGGGGGWRGGWQNRGGHYNQGGYYNNRGGGGGWNNSYRGGRGGYNYNQGNYNYDYSKGWNNQGNQGYNQGWGQQGSWNPQGSWDQSGWNQQGWGNQGWGNQGWGNQGWGSQGWYGQNQQGSYDQNQQDWSAYYQQQGQQGWGQNYNYNYNYNQQAQPQQTTTPSANTTVTPTADASATYDPAKTQ